MLNNIPVINLTEVHRSFQNPGDKLDLIALFVLPEIDLQAFVHDITQNFSSRAL